MGWGKRFYKSEECSELCLCHSEEKLACSVLECVEPRPCETVYAVYTHAAPAYQAARGECFCYSGSFICVRPPKGESVCVDGTCCWCPEGIRSKQMRGKMKDGGKRMTGEEGMKKWSNIMK